MSFTRKDTSTQRSEANELPVGRLDVTQSIPEKIFDFGCAGTMRAQAPIRGLPSLLRGCHGGRSEV